ncbi:MAG: phosphatidate cytidylyltransferase [Phycisphaeraceae bacterium]|nr:phosphatidate cytidylyltransferase [Phycisphaeraceae bacterium]
MLGPRLLTGSLLIAALGGLLWLDHSIDVAHQRPGVVLAALVFIVVVPLLATEVARLLRAVGVHLPTGLAIVAAVAGVLATAGVPCVMEPAPSTAAVSLALLTGAGLFTAASRRTPQGATTMVGGALLVFVIAGVLPGFWIKVRLDFTAPLFVACVLVVKSADIGAYFGGRLIGRSKLIPWLSPGKTREGLACGIVASALIAALFAWLWEGRAWVPPLPWALAGGALLGAVGAMGDLAESLLKRDAGVKDSGRVLPGMGGIFDVLDSLLAAGPLAWILLRL